MEETLKLIAEKLDKDFWDYFAMFTPLVLSVVAILISLWNSFWSNNVKKVDADLIFDEAMSEFYIIIRNVGKKTIVVNSVSLKAKDLSAGEVYELGKREHLWSQKESEGYIPPNSIIKYTPCNGSIYDVFGYEGHFFDVTDENENLMVNLEVEDMDGQKWIFRTRFTLGEIDKKLKCVG